jgi:ABC-2 type transport system permease protein
MNTLEPGAELLGADPAPAAPPAPTAGPPRVLRTLIRREFWEHRALWIAPLSVALLLLLGAIIGKVNFDSSLAALPEQRRALFGVGMAYAALPQFITLGIITWMYAGDCLYTERKDRSILFWKSMPVSDTLTVLSKLLVVTVVVPLGIYLVSALTTLLMSGIYLVRAWEDHSGEVFWDSGTWLRIQGISLIALIAGVLWYAPVTAFLMLVSAWARRSAQLWVLLPPVVLIMMERIALGTNHVMDVVLYRLGAVFAQANPRFPGPDEAAGHGRTLNLLFASVDPFPLFANVDLWLGLLVAALLIVATIRIRQYRDDT